RKIDCARAYWLDRAVDASAHAVRIGLSSKDRPPYDDQSQSPHGLPQSVVLCNDSTTGQDRGHMILRPALALLALAPGRSNKLFGPGHDAAWCLSGIAIEKLPDNVSAFSVRPRLWLRSPLCSQQILCLRLAFERHHQRIDFGRPGGLLVPPLQNQVVLSGRSDGKQPMTPIEG